MRLRICLLLAIAICATSLALDSLPIAVSGRALDTARNPIARATADLLVDGRSVAHTSANAHGFFKLSGGHGFETFKVAVSAPGHLTAALDLRTGTALLHLLGSISGQVLDDTGAPVEGALVAAVNHQRKRWSATTGADGRFAIERLLPPGSLDVVVVAPRHDAFEASLAMRPDESLTVSPVLVRQLGTLSLSTDPAGVQPLLDGKPIPDCPATPCSVGVIIGRHTLRIDTDLYVPWERSVDVGRAETVTINQTLERKTGTLVVNAVALDGSVLAVDGNAIAPGWHGLLPTGSHAVTLTSPATWPQSKSVTVNWNQETDVAMTPTTVATGNAAAFVSQMQAYLGGLGGQYGVYLQDLNSGQEMGSGQDALMEAASVIKIPVALYTYKQVEAKQLKLDDTVTLQDSDFMGGTGVLYYNANAGDKYSYRDLVALLIQQSDNTAWQALRRVLGSGSIDSYAATIGAPQCRQVDDNCTPRQAGLMLAALSRGSLLNATDTQVLLGLLESTVFNDRINFYLSGTTVAHKVGMDGGVMNDSGIVFLPGRPFVISMFTDSDNPDQGVQAIRDVARAAYWYYSH